MQFFQLLALSAVAMAAAVPEPQITAAPQGAVGGGGGGKVGSTVLGGGGGHIGSVLGGGGSGTIESSALIGCFSYHLGPYAGSTCYTDVGPTATAAA